MSTATSTHHLSKLDLFTPNVLHPTLPPLTTGTYPVMGTAATMILSQDVFARSAHIASLLGDKCEDLGYMQRRVAAHDRIVAHMRIRYCGEERRWVAAGWSGGKVARSMGSEEGRRGYVERGLEREWGEMGGRDVVLAKAMAVGWRR
jgi:hypothetical protein